LGNEKLLNLLASLGGFVKKPKRQSFEFKLKSLNEIAMELGVPCVVVKAADTNVRGANNLPIGAVVFIEYEDDDCFYYNRKRASFNKNNGCADLKVWRAS
jgi:hypothetical protein